MVDEKEVDWEYEIGFLKLVSDDDGVMYIAGEASNEMKDNDDEIMDMDSLKGAFDTYMKNPVIRFMHDKSPQWRGAIGKVVEKYTEPDGKEHVTKFGETPYLVAKFTKETMPDWMWASIKEEVYKGFSIGGKALKKVKGRIFVKSWLETSVVDVPSANGAFFTVLKSACVGPDCPYEKSHDFDGYSNVEKFIESFDNFLKGGKGSGNKGHRTISAVSDKNMKMDIKDVKKKLLKHMPPGEIKDIENNGGEKMLRAHLQRAESKGPVRISKFLTILDEFLKDRN